MMNSCAKIVNYIRGKALNHHMLLKAFCSDLDDDASVLLFHTNVRQLSRGRVLTTFFERRLEITQFLREQKSSLVHTFKSSNFAPMLANLASVFQHLNRLNLAIQEKK